MARTKQTARKTSMHPRDLRPEALAILARMDTPVARRLLAQAQAAIIPPKCEQLTRPSPPKEVTVNKNVVELVNLTQTPDIPVVLIDEDCADCTGCIGIECGGCDECDGKYGVKAESHSANCICHDCAYDRSW